MTKNKDNVLLLLNHDSKIKLNKTNGTLETLNAISALGIETIKVSFKKSSMIYKLLDGRSLLKDIYKKDRLIAVKIDDKLNATELTGEELKTFEEEIFKSCDFKWNLLFKNSFGI